MPRVDTLNFLINGEEFVSHVNVNKAGVFSVKLHWKVSKCLGLDSELKGDTKDSVVDPVMKEYDKYLTAKKEYKLFIVITYKASKEFAKHKNGDYMFSHFTGQRKFYVDGFSSDGSSLVFGFEMRCKETAHNGVVVWHKVVVPHKERRLLDWDVLVEGFLLDGIDWGVNGKIMIPYTEKAIETLSKAQEGIRAISEILYSVVSQDTESLISSLNSGVMLPSGGGEKLDNHA